MHLYSPPLPLQTGSTLFHTLRAAPPSSSLGAYSLPYPPPAHPYWTYTKTEFAIPINVALASEHGFTHVILEGGLFERGGWAERGWETVGSTSGFGGVGFRRAGTEGAHVKQRLTIPRLGWEVVVKEGTVVDLVRRVGWDTEGDEDAN